MPVLKHPGPQLQDAAAARLSELGAAIGAVRHPTPVSPERTVRAERRFEAAPGKNSFPGSSIGNRHVFCGSQGLQGFERSQGHNIVSREGNQFVPLPMDCLDGLLIEENDNRELSGRSLRFSKQPSKRGNGPWHKQYCMHKS